mmetsp:Transcript_24337/g.64183  ORF Transcript_24337/g.64183 Transcript_24337/m.64183 type:complete len:138 (-) Transcript_24337:264-677(-)
MRGMLEEITKVQTQVLELIAATRTIQVQQTPEIPVVALTPLPPATPHISSFQTVPSAPVTTLFSSAPVAARPRPTGPTPPPGTTPSTSIPLANYFGMSGKLPRILSVKDALTFRYDGDATKDLRVPLSKRPRGKADY